MVQRQRGTLATQPAVSPQARPGNTSALRHGLYSRAGSGLRLRTRRVRRLTGKVFGALPWLTPADVPTVRSWAELEIIGASVFTMLEADGVTTAQGEPRRLLSDWRQLKQVQLAYERELGMTPASRAALRVDSLRGDDLAAELKAARAADAEKG